MALKVRLSLSKPLLFNKAAQLVTEIEKSVGCCWGVKALVRHYKARFSTVQHHICLLCVCVSVCVVLCTPGFCAWTRQVDAEGPRRSLCIWCSAVLPFPSVAVIPEGTKWRPTAMKTQLSFTRPKRRTTEHLNHPEIYKNLYNSPAWRGNTFSELLSLWGQEWC